MAQGAVLIVLFAFVFAATLIWLEGLAAVKQIRRERPQLYDWEREGWL